jgi:putative ABC transport system substrate-binding protein
MSGPSVRRRDFIVASCAAAVSWPLAVRAQQNERTPLVGVLMSLHADDPDGPARTAALRQELQQLGWIEGRNLRTAYRWGAGDLKLFSQYAAELVSLAPDIVLATAGPIVAALQRETRTIPIVFTTTIDPVGLGYVESLARPGGNVTGIAYVAEGLSGKYLQLLNEIAPQVSRIAVLHDPTVHAGVVQLKAIQGEAPLLGFSVTSVNVRDIEEREHAIAILAREANAGLIVPAGMFATVHRREIVALAAQYRLPAIYSNRHYVISGGLMSYGPDYREQYRIAAHYIHRILLGAKPADLPVQAASRYETVLSIKTAKALSLEVSRMTLARVDEIVE